MTTDTLGSFEPVESERHEPTEEEIMIQLNKLVDLKSITQLPRLGIRNEDFPELEAHIPKSAYTTEY